MTRRVLAPALGCAAFAALLLAAYAVGASQGRPQPLPAWKHSVAYRLRSAEARP